MEQMEDLTEKNAVIEKISVSDRIEKKKHDDLPQMNTTSFPSAVSLSPKLNRTVITNKEDSGNAMGKQKKRSKTCSEINTKFKSTISNDCLLQLKKKVEEAMKDHKIFSIKGGWPVIRKELLKRNWIEKYESNNRQRKFHNLEDFTNNLPPKQNSETSSAYLEKCEKIIMSRMLMNYDPDLYWSMRKEASDLIQRDNPYKLINRFRRSLFASKEGLALLLQQAYWYIEENVSDVYFPRCYVLGFRDHYNLFIDDFRLTACIGLLKWFIHCIEANEKFYSSEGTIQHAILKFAFDRCSEFIANQKHLDLDYKNSCRIWDNEWEEFLNGHNAIIHNNELFENLKDKLSIPILYHQAKACLKEVKGFWPQYDIDGMKNIWILKPGNKCRGRGIHLIKDIKDVDKVMDMKMKYIVQKYIEKPLIIYKTKFDIRQWFLVTNVQPLTIWMYQDSYLRFSSQIFNLENFHESLHLTNHAVQCKYTNEEQRDKALPHDNMWDCHTFKAYLKQIGCYDKWSKVILPGMKASIICAMLASQETMDRRPNTFEMYGADFVLSENFTPWLLEINCCPDLSYSTSVTSQLCPQCMEDIIKVVVDRRRNCNASTGLFDLIYKQNYYKLPPYLGIKLSLRGRKMFRNKMYRATSKLEEKHCYKKSFKEKQCSGALIKPQKSLLAPVEKKLNPIGFVNHSIPTKVLLKQILSNQVGLYKGPVIKDLAEDWQNTDIAFHHTMPSTDLSETHSNEPLQIIRKKKHGTNRKHCKQRSIKIDLSRKNE